VIIRYQGTTTNKSSLPGINTDLRGAPEETPDLGGDGMLLTESFQADPRKCLFLYFFISLFLYFFISLFLRFFVSLLSPPGPNG
jgi:hypothetical protein